MTDDERENRKTRPQGDERPEASERGSGHDRVKTAHGKGGQDKPALAYVAGVTGLLLTFALIGLVARELFVQSGADPIYVAVKATGTHAAGPGYEVEFEARNLSAETASNVQIGATLQIPGAEPIESQVSLDYVPGNSTRSGGIFLPVDPALGKLDLRAHGYAKP